jgi:hypothetical protein
MEKCIICQKYWIHNFIGMKKLFYLFMLLPLGLFGQTQVISVGTVANDGTGDPIRTAFQKVNTNRAATVDSFAVHNGVIQAIKYDSLGNIYTEAQTRQLFNDSITARIAAGVDLETFVDNKLENLVGGGGAVGMYQLRGIIDVTPGIPEDGDSLVFNSGFTEHPHLQVYRDGVMQWHIEGKSNTDGTQNAYVFDQDEGKIIVAPTFSAGEKLIINAFDPIIWTELTPEGGSGGGGEPGGSSLLTSLLASWSFDETSGTVANDNVSTRDGYISGGVVNQSGKFGKSILHDTQTDYVRVTNHSSLYPGDSLTVSLWFKLNSLPSAGDKNFFLIRHYYTSAQPWAYEIFISKSTNYIAFYVYNNSDTYFAAETNDNAVVADTWYNLICTIGAGTTPKIYLNNSDVTSYTNGGNFSGTIRTANIQDLYIGNALYDGTSAPMGYIDEVNIWSRIISSGERSSLQTKYYPFN